MHQQNIFCTVPDPQVEPRIIPPTPITLPYRAVGDKVTPWEIRCIFQTEVFISARIKDHRYLEQDEFWFWKRIIESGKSYMVGDIPTSKYLRDYSSSLSKWQKAAYMWAIENSNEILVVETKTHHWRVYQRGEYVEFALPHQEHGGERNYVTRNGKTKVLVNVD